MFRKSIYILFAIFLFGASFGYSQKEAEAGLPELRKFEEVISPIWHKAYPAKDYSMLRSYSGEVKANAKKIYAAKLPGELREKKARWDDGIKEFKKAVNNYVKCSSGKNNSALLEAAEELHSGYEGLIKILMPVSKEVDDFHNAFHIVYHNYLPNKEYGKILLLKDKLLEKAEAITKMQLPEKHEENSSKIYAAAGDLLKSVKGLANFSETSKGEEIEIAIDNIHSKYEFLVSLF